VTTACVPSVVGSPSTSAHHLTRHVVCVFVCVSVVVVLLLLLLLFCMQARVISMATRFDTLLRQFDRLQSSTRRAVVQGFLSLAKLHNIPIQRPTCEPPKSSQRQRGSSKDKKGGHKKPWMKSMRVVRAASGMMSPGTGFLFRDKKETQAWMKVKQDGFFTSKTRTWLATLPPRPLPRARNHDCLFVLQLRHRQIPHAVDRKAVDSCWAGKLWAALPLRASCA